MPGKKSAHRLYSNDGHALIDLLQRPDEDPPEVGKRVLCRHPFHVRRTSKPMLINWSAELSALGPTYLSLDVVLHRLDVPLPFSQSYPQPKFGGPIFIITLDHVP